MSKVRELVERTKKTARVSVREYFRPVVFVWKCLTDRSTLTAKSSEVGLATGSHIEATPAAAIPPVQQPL